MNMYFMMKNVTENSGESKKWQVVYNVVTDNVVDRGTEVASVVDREGLARAGNWFIKSTFPPLIF